MMFTGIIETIGTITNILPKQNYKMLSIRPDSVFSDIVLGESIAMDGCCLTVVDFGKVEFTVEASPESLSLTIIEEYRNRTRVNLERAILPTSRMGGHFVTGHIDHTGIVAGVESRGEVYELSVKFPREFDRLIVAKGSIAINGISLTVNEIRNDLFSVNIIPHTKMVTTSNNWKKGDKVNLEFDIMGKYIARFLSEENRNNLTLRKLMESGWS